MKRISVFCAVTLFFAVTTFLCYGLEGTINWNDVKQRIDGFGASDAWFSDEIMQHPQRDKILDLLFKKDGGAGLSILRHRVSPKSPGTMQLESGDLDLGKRRCIGIRLTDIAVPRGASIENAFVQFSSEGDYSLDASLTISGQDAADPSTFSATTGDISNRARVGETVTWNVPSWAAGQRGDAQKTPDIKSIVQAIVNNDSWETGNSLVIIVTGLTGPRSAATFDQSAENAPELTVTFDGSNAISRKVEASTDDAEEEGGEFHYDHLTTREAFARDCEIVWAAAWTPPAEWKTNSGPNSGELLKAHYQDFADYLEQYRRRHDEATGIPLYGISPQNEPGKKPWESCVWDKNDFRDFIRDNLGPTLKSSCRIIAPEETRWNNVDEFYMPIHEDAEARKHVDILAGHCYPPSDISISYNKFGKPVWMTEWSYNTSDDDLSIGNGVRWAMNFWNLLVKAEVTACHHWWLVNCKGDGKQQGLIAVPDGSTDYSVSKRLWTIGNFSKFVRPGWHRIDATGDLGWRNYCAAFKNAETGDFAIVLINDNNESRSVNLNFNGFTCASVTPHRTSATEDLKQLPAIDAGSSLSVESPAKTVTTYVGKADALRSAGQLK